MENITSLYKDNTNQKYLNYLKPSQVSFLGSECLRAVFFKKKTPGSLQTSWKGLLITELPSKLQLDYHFTQHKYSYYCDMPALLRTLIKRQITDYILREKH